MSKILKWFLGGMCRKPKTAETFENKRVDNKFMANEKASLRDRFLKMRDRDAEVKRLRSRLQLYGEFETVSDKSESSFFRHEKAWKEAHPESGLGDEVEEYPPEGSFDVKLQELEQELEEKERSYRRRRKKFFSEVKKFRYNIYIEGVVDYEIARWIMENRGGAKYNLVICENVRGQEREGIIQMAYSDGFQERHIRGQLNSPTGGGGEPEQAEDPFPQYNESPSYVYRFEDHWRYRDP